MMEVLKRGQQWIDARVKRERILLLLTALAVVFMLWNLILANPMEAKRVKLQDELKAQMTERQSLTLQITNLSLAAATGPEAQRQQQITQLQRMLTELDKTLAEQSQALIPASQLPAALEAVLTQLKGMELVSIATQPVEELALQVPSTLDSATAKPATDKVTEQQRAGVYKHVVLVTLKGSYFDLLGLLQQLENLPWRFYWEALDYTVDQYPRAQVELKVYTLSAEEGLLGV